MHEEKTARNYDNDSRNDAYGSWRWSSSRQQDALASYTRIAERSSIDRPAGVPAHGGLAGALKRLVSRTRLALGTDGLEGDGDEWSSSQHCLNKHRRS